jgi:hypothetical protein
MFDSFDIGGKGILGILAVIAIVGFVLYYGSTFVNSDGFDPFLGVGVGSLVILIILGIFGIGGGAIIAKFR